MNINPGHDYQESVQRSFFRWNPNRAGQENFEVLRTTSTDDGRTLLIVRSTVKGIYQ